MLTARLQKYFLAFRHSRVFLGLALGLAWLCFYCVLLSTDESGGSLMTKVIARHNYTLAIDRSPNGKDNADALERECKLNAGELRMSSLQPILRDLGLRLVYPTSQRSLKLDAGKSTGRCMSEILLDLLQPHGFGFFRQGSYLYVTEATTKQERKQPEKAGSSPFQSTLVRTIIRAKVGEPIDLWVDRNPLMRLRIEAQPLYGESQAAATPNLIGFTIEGQRDQEPWFYQKMRSALGEESQIDVKAGGHMWCLLTPVSLEGNEITVKLEFYYETILPTV